MNETWLNGTISNKEILDPEFTIYRKDRKDRRGGRALIAVKTDSFKSVKEFSHRNQEELEIVSTELKTVEDKKILYSCCYRPSDANLCWMDKFEYFLHTICDQYENVVFAGDFNLPNINWETTENTTGVSELFFVQKLNHHYPSQLNHTPSRGNNILDLVITNVPDNVNLTQILSPQDTPVFSDHYTISFDFSAFVRKPRKSVTTIYDYSEGNIKGLCSALREKDLSTSISEFGDINTNWKCWKNSFLSTVSEYIPKTKLSSRNPTPD